MIMTMLIVVLPFGPVAVGTMPNSAPNKTVPWLWAVVDIEYSMDIALFVIQIDYTNFGLANLLVYRMVAHIAHVDPCYHFRVRFYFGDCHGCHYDHDCRYDHFYSIDLTYFHDHFDCRDIHDLDRHYDRFGSIDLINYLDRLCLYYDRFCLIGLNGPDRHDSVPDVRFDNPSPLDPIVNCSDYRLDLGFDYRFDLVDSTAASVVRSLE